MTVQYKLNSLMNRIEKQTETRKRVLTNIDRTRNCERQTIQAVASKAKDDGSLYYDRSQSFRERRTSRSHYELNLLGDLFSTNHYPSERFDEDPQFRAVAREECEKIVECLVTSYTDRNPINYAFDETKSLKETISELIKLAKSKIWTINPL